MQTIFGSVNTNIGLGLEFSNLQIIIGVALCFTRNIPQLVDRLAFLLRIGMTVQRF